MSIIVFLALILFVLTFFLLSRKGVSANSIERKITIGVCNPFISDGVLNILSKYSSNNPDVEIFIICADEEILIKHFNEKKLDLLLLSIRNNMRQVNKAKIKNIKINTSPLLSRYSNILIEPYECECLKLELIYNDEELGSLFDSVI